MFQACVIADSISPRGRRLCTFEIEFPRIVLAEAVTHRANSDCWDTDRTTDKWISKNSASSRAIPLKRMIAMVLSDPYIPDRFSAAGPGMTANGYLEGEDAALAKVRWLEGRNSAVGNAVRLLNRDDYHSILEEFPEHRHVLYISELTKRLSTSVHKQDVNRLLEPWLWVKQVVTSSNWENFFALRCHRDAHPALQQITRMMFILYTKFSRPRRLEYGEWHLPYIRLHEPTYHGLSWEDLSAARCAAVSYWLPGSENDFEKAVRLVKRLKESDPKHASPFEHQATPMRQRDEETHPEQISNLTGWLQYRKLIPRERATSCNFSEDEIASWAIDEESLHAGQKKWDEDYSRPAAEADKHD